MSRNPPLRKFNDGEFFIFFVLLNHVPKSKIRKINTHAQELMVSRLKRPSVTQSEVSRNTEDALVGCTRFDFLVRWTLHACCKLFFGCNPQWMVQSTEPLFHEVSRTELRRVTYLITEHCIVFNAHNFPEEKYWPRRLRTRLRKVQTFTARLKLKCLQFLVYAICASVEHE